jgi:uncharacterized membrane protein YfcA
VVGGGQQHVRAQALTSSTSAYCGSYSPCTRRWSGGTRAPLAAGFLIGGYAGQRLVRHLPVAVLRVIVALAGLALAVKLGISAYR